MLVTGQQTGYTQAPSAYAHTDTSSATTFTGSDGTGQFFHKMETNGLRSLYVGLLSVYRGATTDQSTLQPVHAAEQVVQKDNESKPRQVHVLVRKIGGNNSSFESYPLKTSGVEHLQSLSNDPRATVALSTENEFEWVELSNSYECCWRYHAVIRIVTAKETVLCQTQEEAAEHLGLSGRSQLGRRVQKEDGMAIGKITGAAVGGTYETFDCSKEVCCSCNST